MARSYSNTSTKIWRDPEHRALSLDEQYGLHLLSTQPDISAAGALPLTIRRWAAMSQGNTVERLRAALDGLQRAGQIVMDEETEEVLVCSFLRDDKGYSNPKRRPSIIDAAGEIVSLALRRALATEFRRVGLPVDCLGLPPEPDGPQPGRDRQSDSHSDRQSDPYPQERADTPPPEPVNPIEPDATDHADIHDLVSRKPSSIAYPIGNQTSTDSLSVEQRIVVTQGPYIGSSSHNPHLSSRTPPPSGPIARFVTDATGATDDETREIISKIQKQHKPRNLRGYIQAMAGNGDLTALLDEVRQQHARTAAAAERRAQLAAAPDPATEPPPSQATPEEAAAARAYMRQLLSGQVARGGDPAAIGAVLGKERSA